MRCILVSLALWCVAGCVTKHAPEPHERHWSYSGDTGPTHWAELDANFNACASGKAQTPIDFPSSTVPGLMHGLSFQYQPSKLALVNNGHTVQANYDPGSHLQWNGERYELVQFHFHAHSEHTVAGKSYPLELHLVHKSAQGKLAVVGILFESGEENRALAPVFEHLPSHANETTATPGVQVDTSGIVPEHLWAYQYTGSLTTPPCSENVLWFVLSQPMAASPAQLQAYTALYPDDYRPTQPRNGRAIEGAHFTYEGEEGPTHWAEQSPSWTLCQTGKQQSPIDIPAGAKPDVPADLAIEYKAAPLHIVNNGHTVEVEYPAGSAIELSGTQYSLVQFHMHAHSEHTIAGKSYPLELHLVHRNADGGLAVLGVMIEQGAHNAALEPFFANLPTDIGPEHEVPRGEIDAAKLLPESRSMWRYAGSLTTPPCSENVKWHLFATPITASPEQIEHFTHLYRADARPVQPLGDRVFGAQASALAPR